MSAIRKVLERIWPHAVWEFTKWLFFAILAAGAGRGVWAMTYWARLTHGLTPAQQHDLLVLYGLQVIIVIIAALVMLTILMRSRRRNSRQATQHIPSGGAASPDGLRLEILDVLFHCDSAIMQEVSHVDVLLQVRAVNRAAITRVATRWTLTVKAGTFSNVALMEPVDQTLVIERRPRGEWVPELIPRPTWDELTEYGLATGAPKIAWVAFFFCSLDRRFLAAPNNAELLLTVEDSMGDIHTVVREPQMYFDDARLIKSDASRVLAVGTS